MLFRAFLILVLMSASLGFLYQVDSLNSYTLAIIFLFAIIIFLLLGLERLRAFLFTRWLKRLPENPQENAPVYLGAWQEMAFRVARLLQKKDHAIAERQIELDNLYAALFVSPDGIILLDERKHIFWCNAIACQHFGLDASRDQGQLITHLLRDPLLVAYITAQTFEKPVMVSSPVGDAPHTLKLSVQLYPYGAGSWLLESRDITAILQAEAMRRDFIANVSHEIRTPLSVLSGFIETLQTLPLSESAREDYLDRMAKQSDRMRQLVDDLLTLSRIEANASPDFSTWVSVRGLIAQCDNNARALSTLLLENREPHHLIFPDLQTLDDEIAGNAQELQSAFENLVHNAIRYTPAGGTIEVTWKKLPEGGAALIVKDSGQGIAPEHIPRLTERFYRVDSDRSRATGGTGLGLSIVKHIVQKHDAALSIDSVLGHGATFTISFPKKRIRGT